MGCSQVVNPPAPSLQVLQLVQERLQHAAAHTVSGFRLPLLHGIWPRMEDANQQNWQSRSLALSIPGLPYRRLGANIFLPFPALPNSALVSRLFRHVECKPDARCQADSGGHDPEQLPVGPVCSPPTRTACVTHTASWRSIDPSQTGAKHTTSGPDKTIASPGEPFSGSGTRRCG